MGAVPAVPTKRASLMAAKLSPPLGILTVMRTYQALACRNPARGELSGGLASPRDRGEQAEICCTGLAPMANPAKLPGGARRASVRQFGCRQCAGISRSASLPCGARKQTSKKRMRLWLTCDKAVSRVPSRVPLGADAGDSGLGPLNALFSPS